MRSYTYEDQYGTGSTLPTTDGRYSFTWDGRMLISATRISDNKKIDFEYDHDGKLTKKTVTDENGSAKVTKYYYTDGSLTTEARYEKSGASLTLTEKLDYIYDSTGLAFIIMEITNDSETYISSGEYTFYVKRNAQGDITALTDITNGYQDGTVYYTYSAYGKGSVQGISGDSTAAISVLNSLLFKGYMYDSDFKMYYLGSRWYDPEIGRFINGDSYISTGQGVIGYNMFAYCGNNPVNRADPEGKFFGHIIAALVIVAGVIITASSCSSKKSPEPYKSADEAAMAFANSTYSSSKYIRHEYGTMIYSRTIDGSTTYNYAKPISGSPHSVGYSDVKVPSGTKKVATAHTHPNSNSFSGLASGATSGDIPNAIKRGMDSYVVGPNLNLQKFSISSQTVSIVGIASPVELTSQQQSELVLQFQISWDKHLGTCNFGCENMTWPTP